jgi:ABC-type multidrug transport system fused ATPase/permease subunit
LSERNPQEIYRRRLELFKSKIKKIRNIETALALIKLALAIVFVIVFYLAAMAYTSLHLFGLMTIVFVFTFIAIIHENFIKKRTFFESLQSINEDEIRTLNHEFPDSNFGEPFQNPDHPYTFDLDFFSQRGIFHFINRAKTGMGWQCLAGWLKNPLSKTEITYIKERQNAAWELSDKIDLRQNVQAHGQLVDHSMESLKAITGLIDEPLFILPNKGLILFIHIMPFISLGFIGLIFAGLPWPVIFLPIAGQYILNRRMRDKLTRIYQMAVRNSRILRNYSEIIDDIEKADFSCEMLKGFKDNLYTNKRPASFYISKLSSLVGYLELRRNQFFHPLFNNLFFWDLFWTFRIERWKAKIASHVPDWFDAIGNFEALSSFASLCFNFPGWAMPEMSLSEFEFKAQNLGHPLIPEHLRVCNDINMDGRGEIWIITGPNMSGKSTLLKTVGVNMVLALAGAPVCAETCVISPAKLYTNLKVNDSLDKNLSLFYAELQRLKMVVDSVVEKETVFFLLDEMLKGTNALDRQAGAFALLRQLCKSESNGFVATHDLELTKLEEDFPEKIKNYHFDGYVEDDKLYFDFELKAGKCESFNALLLMRKMGIDV